MRFEYKKAHASLVRAKTTLLSWVAFLRLKQVLLYGFFILMNFIIILLLA